MAHSKTPAGIAREKARNRAYYWKNREACLASGRRSVAKKPEVYRERNKERMRQRRAEARLVALFTELLEHVPETILSSLCGEGCDVRVHTCAGERPLSARRAEIEAYGKQAATRGHAL